METNPTNEAKRLLNMRDLGDYLGRPARSLERQLVNPPPGFPAPVRFGRLRFWSRALVDVWLLGQHAEQVEPAAARVAGQGAVKRARGRPPKQIKEAAVTGQG